MQTDRNYVPCLLCSNQHLLELTNWKVHTWCTLQTCSPRYIPVRSPACARLNDFTISVYNLCVRQFTGLIINHLTDIGQSNQQTVSSTAWHLTLLWTCCGVSLRHCVPLLRSVHGKGSPSTFTMD